MSITKPIIVYGLLPSLHIKPSSQTRITLSSSKFKHDHNHSVFSGTRRIAQKDIENRRRFFVCNFAQSGAPPPSEPPSNFINWIVGVALTVILPFFRHKWVSLLKIKNDVETTVQNIEDIVEAVEQAADRVEKVAEDISDDLPAGGRLRKAVDFIENIAERASEDAHTIGDLIDRVQEAEASIESLTEEAINEHHKQKDRAHDQKVQVEVAANDDRPKEDE